MPISQSPGPGSYHVDVRPVTPTPPAYTIAVKPPLSSEVSSNDQLPGPGTYNSKISSSAPSYSIQGKHASINHEKRNIPGPGAYNAASPNIILHKPPAYTLAGRISDFSVSRNPGPGSYTLPKPSTGPSHVITGKSSSPSSERAAAPGPGTYDVSDNTKLSVAAYTIGSKCNPSITQAFPGPGTYSPVVFSDGPAYSLSQRIKPQSKTATPGPGAYGKYNLAANRRANPAYTIGCRVKEGGLGNGEAPGPGAYTPLASSKQDSGPAYTIAGRPVSFTPCPNPGPGTYELGGKIESPAYSIARRSPLLHGDTTPGPGSYNLKAAHTGPVFSFPRKSDVGQKRDIPGPATYNIDAHSVHTHSPEFSMGTRFSDALRKEFVPGPGTYSPTRSKPGPAYSISKRLA